MDDQSWNLIAQDHIESLRNWDKRFRAKTQQNSQSNPEYVWVVIKKDEGYSAFLGVFHFDNYVEAVELARSTTEWYRETWDLKFKETKTEQGFELESTTKHPHYQSLKITVKKYPLH